jgi:hypothetical protein
MNRYRDLGQSLDLAAGLAAVLDGLDPEAVAPEGLAVLPTVGLPAGACVLPHALAARDGLSVVRFPRRPGGAGYGRGLTGSRAAALAAVRLGVLSRMLDMAVWRLAGRRFGGVLLIDKQLVIGAVADVVTDLELSAAASVDDDTAAEIAAAQHERLTEVGWMVARFFGAEGYIADHPVRALYVSTLIADVWVPRPSGLQGGC